ncbi:MAG: trigger factor [Eubacterium sp.]|nr:trigger factor [Eubacterium sp.]
MKKIKAALVILLAGTMVFAGCGTTKDTTKASSKASSASSSKDSEAASSKASSKDTSKDTSKDSSKASSKDSSAESKADSSASSSSASSAEAVVEEIPVISGAYVISEIVDLGNYKGLNITMEDTEVKDDEVDAYISNLVQPVEVEDENTTVKEGDTANIAYVGKIDGEEFEGGTSQSADVVVGSDTFIPGFEDGLIGMKKGETKDLNLTFPENYGDKGGQDVVFTVTVNAIKRPVTVDDAWVEEYTLGEYKTLKEFWESTRENLEKDKKNYAEYMAKTNAWQEILQNAEIKGYPEELLKKYADDFDAYVDKEAEASGMDREAFLQASGMTEEVYNEYRDQSARAQVRNELVQQALVEAEGVKKDSDEYKEELQRLLDDLGMTEEEAYENYGAETIEMSVLWEIAMDNILSYSNLVSSAAAVVDGTGSGKAVSE